MRYRECKIEAQNLANATGADYGIEQNELFKTWRKFRLPWPQSRSGYELKCEVVMCEDWEKRERWLGKKQ